MTRGQTTPEQWPIAQTPLEKKALQRLQRGSGLLILGALEAAEGRYLRRIDRSRGLIIAALGPKSAVRVHNFAELRLTFLKRKPFVILSPIFPTLSHPDWAPFPRMRAASLARLAKRNLTAWRNERKALPAHSAPRLRRLGRNFPFRT